MHKATGAIRSEWSLRGLDNKALTIHTEAGGYWFLTRQFVYRNGALAAAKTAREWRAMHLDHLGTPRAITDPSGTNTAYHSYYASGEEATGVRPGRRANKSPAMSEILRAPLGRRRSRLPPYWHYNPLLATLPDDKTVSRKPYTAAVLPFLYRCG